MKHDDVLTLRWSKSKWPTTNEQPRRKRRGIKQKILNAPRGGELNPRQPLAD